MPAFPPSARIVFWDLETSNLNADFGYILSAAWKRLGERKIQVVTLADFPRYERNRTDDRDLARAVAAELDKADVIVSWYGLRFDQPYLNTRLLRAGLPPMAPVPHVDLWRTSRYQLALHSNRLASAAAFFGLEDKTAIKGQQWVDAAAGMPYALRYVASHNRQDIVVLEQAYLRLRPLVERHPNVGVMTDRIDGCPRCGGRRIASHGWRVSGVSRTQRFKCRDCGGYSHGAPKRVKGATLR